MMWLIGMIFLITRRCSARSSHDHHPAAREGADAHALPSSCAQFVTAFLPFRVLPLRAAGVMQLMDRVAGTSFFLPSGLVVSGQVLHTLVGNPLLWQHLFWFLAHQIPFLILPAMGIVAEIIANNTRKPSGLPVDGLLAHLLGLHSLSCGHHMFMTGMGTAMAAFSRRRR
jgi:cytochrome c oxidase subunit 1